MDSIFLEELNESLEGDLVYDEVMRTLYATDASAYQELPVAVAFPRTEEDIQKLILFAHEHHTSLIPRTAGTSLAGQVVGKGIVVDVSRHFTRIGELNKSEKWVWVQPGVIRDELNMFLDEHNLLFGPETSTANRAMIGGMIGNNSCGSNSVVYGSTRDHLLEVEGFLSDGSRVIFRDLTRDEFDVKCKLDSLEGHLYRRIKEELSDKATRQEIKDKFPKPEIPRRNTGYAVDLLLETAPFLSGAQTFNFCKLIAGSEGTLLFITRAKMNVIDKPPAESGLLCIHFKSIHESLLGNLVALKHMPYASELMDHYILECTKENITYRQYRFFVQGDPQAILVVELRADTDAEVREMADKLTKDLQAQNLGYHYPLVTGEETKLVWSLRKAGLGLLSNIPGDAKPVPVIEDTAVHVEDLPQYIADFNKKLEEHDLFCVHYAHAGSGELHLRPIINLKTREGNQLFRQILQDIAELVKKYKGSLSGEHGDGRLRGEFIPFMIGDKNYQLLRRIKKDWDPANIFNPGKIVDTPAMNKSLRYKPGQRTPQYDTAFNFDAYQGILRNAELCNGSGDCRKTHLTGGTMCPSYMATKNEKDTTRARANLFREVLTNDTDMSNPFDNESLKDILDLCLSCKGCKAECPSNVDMGKMKAEFLYQYQKENGITFRTKLISNFNRLNKLASKTPWLYNLFTQNSVFANRIKKIAGFAQGRSMPPLHTRTLRKWLDKKLDKVQPEDPLGEVCLFVDEFTNYNDTPAGIAAVKLLTGLGYRVIVVNNEESGRSWLSKGLLDEARELAVKNVEMFHDIVSKKRPLIGIEPSAILSFRDEYTELLRGENRDKARSLAKNTLLLEEFIVREMDAKIISSKQFNDEKQRIRLHGHCHQKAISSVLPTKRMLSLLRNREVLLIPSGCCGMAGSFGYEEEHFDISMQIGELVLFPTIRQEPEETIIAAPGTSCRHQIKDGTDRKAMHPAEIMYNALIKT